jgi:hypothetical protein
MRPVTRVARGAMANDIAPLSPPAEALALALGDPEDPLGVLEPDAEPDPDPDADPVL